MGYHDTWSTTYKILLSENRMVHSRNVTFDLTNFKSEVPKDKPDQRSEDLLTSKFVKNIPIPDATKISNTPTHQGASPGFAPEGDFPSPLIDNDPKIITEDDTLAISPKGSCLFDTNKPTGYLSMHLHNVLRDIPMEFLYRKIPTLTASPTYTDSSLLDIGQQREYSTILGMLNWFTQPVRCDVTHSSSEPEQHRISTTDSTFNVDSQNQRQSQNDHNDLVITNKGFPVTWEYKTGSEVAKILAAKYTSSDFIHLRDQILHPAPM